MTTPYRDWTEARPIKEDASTSDASETFFALTPMFEADRGTFVSDSLVRSQIGVPVDACRFTCAPFGGLIACWPEPNPRHLQAASLAPVIIITLPGGGHRETINLKDMAGQGEQLGRVMGVGWADSEQLVCVFEYGSGRIFTPMGQRESSFSMGLDDHRVLEVMFCNSGVVAVLDDPTSRVPRLQSIMWPLQNFHQPQYTWMDSIPLEDDETPTCYVLQYPVYSDTGQSPTVIVGLSGGGIAQVSSDMHHVTRHPWVASKLAIDNLSRQKQLAVITTTGDLHIISSDTRIQECLASYSLQDLYTACDRDLPPVPEGGTVADLVQHMAWVSSDGVALSLQDGESPDDCSACLCVVDEMGKVAALVTDDVVALSSEIDGCVALGEQSWSQLRAVPASVQRAVGAGSNHNSALLLRASEQHDHADSACESTLESIRGRPISEATLTSHNDMKDSTDSVKLRRFGPDLALAVTECVVAAGWCPDPGIQRKLLRAAVFGKAYCPDVDNGLISSTAHQLRVLNTLRSASSIGRGVTHAQLVYLFDTGRAHYLPDVLCGCYSFFLAKEVALGLELTDSRVLLSWAKATIMKSGREGVNECMELLCAKLDHAVGIPWAEVASTATELGYRDLGSELLSKDPHDSHVVPLLIELNTEAALTKALKTCDEDLMMLVLLSKIHEPNPNASSDHYRFLAQFTRSQSSTSPFDMWHSFVLSCCVPMPQVLPSWKTKLLATHSTQCATHGWPVHSAVAKLTEVLISTAGPAPSQLPEGCQKGRGDNKDEWITQQQILSSVVSDFATPLSGATARKLPAQGMSSVPSGKSEWQFKAVEKFAQLRAFQFDNEALHKLSLVGLSLDATLEKLYEANRLTSYNELMIHFVVDRTAIEHKTFVHRIRFLGKQAKLMDIVKLAESGLSGGRPLRDWNYKIIVYECIAGRAAAVEGADVNRGILERLGFLMSKVQDQQLRDSLLELLRRQNVLVQEDAPSFMGNIQRVSAPLMSTAQDMASNLGATAMRAGGSVATGFQNIQNIRNR